MTIDRVLRRAGTLLGVLVTALALAACGGDDEEGASGGGGGGTESGSGGGGTLVVGAWGGSYNEATKKFYADPFAAQGGAKVQFVDASAAQVARVEAQARANKIEWDMIDSIAAPDGFLLQEKGLLEPLPADLKADLQQTLGEGKVSDFGFTMGNLSYVVACNTEKVDKCPTTVADFFDSEQFPGSRAMPSGAPLMVMTMAMVANGTLPSETATTDVDMDAAFSVLDRIRDDVKVFWESGDQSTQVMSSGEVDMALMWSGVAYRSLENVDVAVEGGAYEPGYWTVVKGAKNKDEAFRFMKFIAESPKQQAGFAQALDYSVPNPKALDELPEEEARRFPDHPDTFPKLAVPNFEWYAANADDLNRRWQDWVRG
jgi:putative spermidine/putrescine transport system substrate-binding protein